MKLFPRLALLTAIIALAGCGGSPAASTPSTTAVSLVLASDIIRVTETTQATATATTSAGSQSVTSGWQSDAPGVASVSASGLVTGVAPGRATIFVASGGRQGQQVVKVNPNFQGVWQGTYTVQSCTQTGIFATANLCASLTGTPPTQLTMTQSRDTVSGTFFLGSIAFPAFTGPIDANGTLTFTSTSVGDPAITALWTATVAADGRLAGNMSQIWRSATNAGELRLETALTSVLKVSAPPLAPRAVRPASIRDAIDAVRAR